MAAKSKENLPETWDWYAWEHRAEAAGYSPVCGVDEAGRGPLAGPVCAAAVILPLDFPIDGLNDSKKLTPLRRAALFEEIKEKAIAWAVGTVDVETIDRVNILQATKQAMKLAVEALQPQAEVLLIDAVHLDALLLPQRSIIKGDGASVSIAAASIVAKETRDQWMREMDAIYPQYGFASNKGYGSAQHIAALRQYGPCPLHRRTFIGHFVE